MSLRLTAFHRNPDGALSVMDIVEPKPRYASWFFNRLRRNPDVWLIEASSAERPLSDTTNRRVAWQRPLLGRNGETE